MEEINSHSIENCPIQKQFLELEEEHNELQKSIQLSAMYGKTLLEENLVLKRQMEELKSLQEVEFLRQPLMCLDINNISILFCSIQFRRTTI